MLLNENNTKLVNAMIAHSVDCGMNPMLSNDLWNELVCILKKEERLETRIKDIEETNRLNAEYYQR
jgi:hypothetical protein